MSYRLKNSTVLFIIIASFVQCSISSKVQKLREIRMHQAELEEIQDNGTTPYVFVGTQVSTILHSLQHAATLADTTDHTPGFDTLCKRLQKGYTTTSKENILSVLDEAELLIQIHSSDEQVEKGRITQQEIDEWRTAIKADELTVALELAASHSPRAPRPNESIGIETETVPNDDGSDLCCALPRDVYVERNLTVGGTLTVGGAVFILGPIVLSGDITLQPLFPQNAICLIWLENAVNGGAEKARLCDSSIVGDKGLYISIDGGATQNFRVTNAGNVTMTGSLTVGNGVTITTNDATLNNGNINLTNSTSAATGNILKDGAIFIHNAGGDLTSTYVGRAAGVIGNTALGNTGLGANALSSVTSGPFNVAVGRSALSSATIGGGNVAVGVQAGEDITTANDNTLIGTQAGANLTTGASNVALGRSALFTAITAASNVAVGVQAGEDITSATDNTLVGTQAGANLTTGSSNVALGRGALLTATTAAGNVTVGVQAGEDITTAADNTLVGAQSGANLTTGGFNVAVGRSTLLAATTGQGHALLGYHAGMGITTSNDNTLIGTEAGVALTTGGNNTALGRRALFTSTTGTMNVALGVQSGNNMTTGSNNTLLGSGAGFSLTTGSNNIHVGINASSGINFDNGIVLQSRPASSGTQLTASNQIRIGFGDTASSTTFIDGINTATIGATANVVGVNASGQLGTTATTLTANGNLMLPNQSQLQLQESTGSGTATVNLRAPTTLSGGSYTLTLPQVLGTIGQTPALTTGTGDLGWITPLTSNSGFVNGGNAFGIQATLGTNDTFPLEIITDNDSRIFIATDGTVSFTGNVILTSGNLSLNLGNATLVTGDLNIDDGNINLANSTSPSVGNLNKNNIHFLHNFGTNNTFIGSNAGNFTLTGTQNVAVGAATGSALSSGNNNVYIGYGTGNATTGSQNTFVGTRSGTSSNNTNCICIQSQPSSLGTSLTDDNQIRIGFGDTASTSTFIDGIRSADIYDFTMPSHEAYLVGINDVGHLGTANTSTLSGISEFILQGRLSVHRTIEFETLGTVLEAVGSFNTAAASPLKLIYGYITGGVAPVLTASSGGISSITGPVVGIYTINFGTGAATENLYASNPWCNAITTTGTQLICTSSTNGLLVSNPLLIDFLVMVAGV